jgi:hypothetical protein
MLNRAFSFFVLQAMIHVSEIYKLVEKENSKMPDIVFNLKFIKASTGEIITAKNVVCTSSYFHGQTRNIKFLDSGEIRKIHDHLIIEINGEEVFV